MGSVYFAPKLDKIIELLVYLAHKGINPTHYQVVKFFYLADKEHLVKYGRPITFEKYCALDHGPVASTVYDLLKSPHAQLRKFGITDLPFELTTYEENNIIVLGVAKRPVDHDVFSRTDLEVFDNIVEKYKNYSFSDLRNETHAHFAYTNAWEHKNPHSKSVEMNYEDMLEETPLKAEIIEHMKEVAEYI